VEACFICGAVADTRDHVPPLGLFPKPRPSTLITVPACLACNRAKDRDDEYFRFIVSAAGDDTPAAAALRRQRILPRLRTHPALGHEIMRKSRIVDAVTPEGVLAPRPALEFDFDRLQRVIAKMVKGLYLHVYGERLEGVAIEDFLLNPDPPADAKAYFATLPRRTVAPDIFSFWCDRDPVDPRISIWFLGFFTQTLFVTQTKSLEGTAPR